MNRNTLVYALVLIWAVVFAGSILISLGIDGPRNIDTGFKRLDTLFRGQILALALALLSLGVALFNRGGSRGIKLIGFAPIGLTILLIGGTVLWALVMKDQMPPVETPPMTPTAPVDGG